VGLSALTAYGLFRFNQLRASLLLPPITSPDYVDALRTAQAELTTKALTETFVAAAVIVVVAFVVALTMRRESGSRPVPSDDADTSMLP
jgi:hypothetical protein